MKLSNLIKIEFILVILFSIFSCKEHKISEKKFTGFWAETTFEYSFRKGNEFNFVTEGHFGNTMTTGKYSIIDSIILLYPYTDWNRFHGVLKTRMIYVDQMNCIKDFENRFYCEDLDAINRTNESVERLKSRVIKKLLSVRDVSKKYEEFCDKVQKEFSYLHFDYEGIILIDNRQFHSFQLKKKNESYKLSPMPYLNVQHQLYLVNLEDRVIYKHHMREDSMSLVGYLD